MPEFVVTIKGELTIEAEDRTEADGEALYIAVGELGLAEAEVLNIQLLGDEAKGS